MSDSERSAVIVGVTGGIACGKSEVARILGKMGFMVCDADRVAHELMVKGTPVYQDIVECFGPRILAEDGEISRPQLGEVVFHNLDRLSQLNRLVHPAVRKYIERWISERRSKGENAVVQIPLLFESKMEDMDWDSIVCVSSAEPLVFERLALRGITRSEARKRIESQMPLTEKESLSDRVIRNIGTLEELEAEARMIVKSLMVER